MSMNPSSSSRRAFLRRLGGAAVVGGLPGGLGVLEDLGPGPVRARSGGASGDRPVGPPRPFDIVVAGGRLIDPASGIDAPMDVGINAGRVDEVAPGIDTSETRRVIDARGKLVTPGLIDVHVHVYDGVALYGVQPEAVGLVKGVTTLIDGGSAGATTFPGFREHVVGRSRTRVLALLNISSPGMTVPNELADLRWVDPEAAVRMIERNRDVIVGLKVRMLAGIPGGGDVEVMRRTREAADAVGLPITVHIGGQTSPLPRILDFLRPGDVVTHALRARGSVLDDAGRVYTAVREAMARGVELDIGHGRGNLDFDTAEAVLAQGVQPTLISSDVHRGNVTGPVFGLPTTLSKFVLMGMSYGDVVRAATATPARVFGLDGGGAAGGGVLGSLEVGAVADLAVYEIASGAYTFVDSGGKERAGGERLVPYVVLMGGREMGARTGG